MLIPECVRRLSYNASIRKLVRTLRLEKPARDWYLGLNRPANGVFRITKAGLAANFIIGRPNDVRLLEPILFEPALEIFLKAVRLGDVVYDVGSNRGVYTLLVAQAVGSNGRVIAFEPANESYLELERNIHLNRVTNVSCYRKALGNQNAMEKLFLGRCGGELEIQTAQQGHRETDPYEMVEVIEGDAVVTREGLPFPQAVKIDVEGYEFAVIEGLSKTLASPGCRLVCCEIHERKLPAGVKPQMILDCLGSLGFMRQEFCPTPVGEYHVFACKGDAATF